MKIGTRNKKMKNPDVDLSQAEVHRDSNNEIHVVLRQSGSYWRLESTTYGLNLFVGSTHEGLGMMRGEAAVLGRELLRFAVNGNLEEQV
jgi:hypothetical protein